MLFRSALTAIIVSAGSFVAGRHRWFKALAGMWFASGTFLLFVLSEAIRTETVPANGAVAILSLVCLVPMIAYVTRFVPNEIDSQGWFVAIAGLMTSIGILFIFEEPYPYPHSLAVALFGASLLVLAVLSRNRSALAATVITGIAVSTVVAPIGFTAFAACVTYGAFGVLASYTKDRKSTRLNSSHIQKSRMPSSA